MPTYRTDDGKILDTDRATKFWREQRDWNGNNHIGRSSGSQWRDDTLYKSSKGRYYLETCSRVQGEGDGAEVRTAPEAAAWLLENEYEIPDDLKAHVEDIAE